MAKKVINNKISLSALIKREIGNRIVFCCFFFVVLIVALTIYDVIISIKQLRPRIAEQIKPIEEFAIDQAMIDNFDAIDLKIDSFNENNPSYKIEWMREGVPFYKKISWRFPFSWVYDYPIGEIAGYQFGYIRVIGGLSDKTLVYDLLLRLGLLFAFVVTVLGILYPLVKRIPEQLFIKPINRFIDLITDSSISLNKSLLDLPVELALLEEKILALLRTATEHERNKAVIEIGHLFARLAHDIHSPLTAMDMSISIIKKSMPMNAELNVLTTGIKSVRDIANNVLERYRNPHFEGARLSCSTSKNVSNIVRPVLLIHLMEALILQKRHEWYANPCEITLSADDASRRCWVKVAPNEFNRIISNIVNNSYDAIEDKVHGEIRLILNVVSNKLLLKLIDNGCGIPSDLIADVLKGKSLKHRGKGLGLSGASEFMSGLSGTLEVMSQPRAGTEVILSFPVVDNIPWYKTSIVLPSKSVVVVLDDDFSMLSYFEQRIGELGLTIKLFSSPDKLLKWYYDNQEIAMTAVYLADYELNNDIDGLTVLETISCRHRGYLITSHADDFYLQEAVQKLGVWLIHKLSLNEVAITCSDVESVDVLYGY